MPETIKLTSEELGRISLFQSISGATARDCILDEKMNRIIFVVNEGDMGLAIGKGGSSIKSAEKQLGKPVEVVEYAEDPKDFIINALNTRKISEIRMSEKPGGTKAALILVDQRHKGEVVGRSGRNAERARLLAKRYFNVESIRIISLDEDLI
ncbi:MAG: NusA-like transcription termination signal-binding factor [Thaumarchaeota archaeon]|nr:NusA-like transcription termination signal-binding factor [Nitrososphaerota archaeon]MCZ6616469.1 NusA-like transcription termination signal-binding factor [Nitrososphaerota archaeon]